MVVVFISWLLLFWFFLQVVLDPVIVFLSSTSSFSAIPVTSVLTTSLKTINVTRFSTHAFSRLITMASHVSSKTVAGRFSSSVLLNGSSTMTSPSTFSRALESSLTPNLELSKTSSLPSRSVVDRNPISPTVLLSRETLASSQTLILSSSSFSLLPSTGAALRSRSTVVESLQPSLSSSLSTSNMSTQSVTLIASSLSLNGSSASDATQSILPTISSITRNSSALTSAQGSTAQTSTTLQNSSSSGIVTVSLSLSSNFSLAVASPTSVLSSFLPIVSSTASVVFSKSLSLNSSLFAQPFTVGSSSSLLASSINVSETIVSSTSTGNNQTALLSSTSATQTFVSSFSFSRVNLSSSVALRTSAFARTLVVSSSSSSLPANVSQSRTPLNTSRGSYSTSYVSQSFLIGPSQTTSSRPLLTPGVSSRKSRQSIKGNSTIHFTSLGVVSNSSIPSSYASEIYTSTIRANLSRSASTHSVIVDRLSSITSPVSRTHFSDTSTPKISYTASMESKSTTLSVEISSLPVVNMSSTQDVSFLPVSTFVRATPNTSMITPTTAASLSSSQNRTTGATVVASKSSLFSQSVQPSISSLMNRSSDTISSVMDVSSIRAVSNSTSVLSSLQTLLSTYAALRSSSALFSSKGLSTIPTKLTTTPDFSAPPPTLTSSSLMTETSVTPFMSRKSVTHSFSATTMVPIVSLAGSLKMVSSSTFITSEAFRMSTLSLQSYSSTSSTKAVSGTTSTTLSSQTSPLFYESLSQTTYKFFSTKTIELLPSSLLKAKTSVKSRIVETFASRSSISAATSNSSFILIHSASTPLLRSSVVTALSSSKAISTTRLSIESFSTFVRTKGQSSARSTVPAVRTPTMTSSYSKSVTLGSSATVVSDSDTLLLPLSSTTVVMGKPSSFPVYSSSAISTDSLSTSLLPPVSPLTPLSSPIHARSTVKVVVTSGKPSKATLLTTAIVKLSSKPISISTTVPLLSFVLPQSSVKDTSTTTTQTPRSSSLVSKTSSVTATPVEPTEPVRPTTNPNNTEGLVGIQLLVPLTENVMNSSFREEIELRLATAYRWGQEKGNRRRKRDLERTDNELWKTTLHLNVRDYESWGRSAVFKVYERRSRRFRRQVDNIVALVSAIL